MKCPACLYEDTKVIDSRVSSDGLSIRRRRECLECEFRFSTYEELEILDLSVIKKDSRREPYNRDKLIRGIRNALEKRPFSEDEFRKFIHAIERDLQVINKNEISSKQIGKIIMRHLKKLDQVAYIRFASVYEEFKDAKEFAKELNKLIKSKKK